MARTVTVIGVPVSVGSYAAGQDLAPAALRAAGLLERLTSAGLDVRDGGDLPEKVWRPDRVNPFAQNLDDVITTLLELADRVAAALTDSDVVLVAGGNCTIAISVLAALHGLGEQPPTMVYLDRGYDLNTPASTTDGALDWMGMAHALSLPGCLDALAGAFSPRPLLTPTTVRWVGVEPAMATDWERRQASELGLHVCTSAEFTADPVAAMQAALGGLPPGPLAVHFDVDVLDFTDAPLAENTDGRNTGPTLEQATDALTCALADPRCRALSVGELNPTRSAGDPEALGRFVDALVRILSVSVVPAAGAAS